MKDLVIGDCHFGIKTNSIFWLNKQIEFFDKVVIPTIRTENIDRIIFLGDITDIRYAINQYIGIELKKLVHKLAVTGKRIIFVAGNHDYYSPVEEYVDYNSYELLFGEDFTSRYNNVTFVTKDPLLENGSLFLPWYWTENPEHFDDMLYRYNIKHDVDAIYCHADLTCWPGPRIASIHGKPIYSGHIHYIVEDSVCNLHNVGAAFAFTFNDVNQDRFIYIIDNNKIVKKIKNDITPRFVRIVNEDIFKDDDSMYDNAYVQLIVSSANINKAEYVDRVKFLKNKYVDSNVRVHIIDSDYEIDNTNIKGINSNIGKYIEDNIPTNLNDKYLYIKDKIKK